MVRQKFVVPRPAQPSLICRGNPWLEDGNIVLQAESTRFKVLRSILCGHSSVFRGLLEIPQPEGQELVDGAPIVHLSDSADEVKRVLRAMFDYSHTPNQIPLATVIAFVRLGRKYDIPHLSLEGFRWLQKEFPSILPQSNIRLDNFSYLGIDDDDFTKSLLNLIKLAREFNFISLLPMLFYITSNIKLEELVRGFREVDIMRSDEITIILGRDALMNTVTKNTFAWLMADYSCRGECNANRQDFFVEHWHPHQHFGAQALIAWDTNWEDDYCADCILASKRLHTQGRQRIWARLPSVFELGSWEDLMM